MANLINLVNILRLVDSTVKIQLFKNRKILSDGELIDIQYYCFQLL